MGAGLNTFTRRAALFLRWARGERSHRLTSTIAGLMPDAIADTARQVLRWTLPLQDTPSDGLVYLLRDYGMPAYIEPYAQTLARVKEFVSVIPYAGAKAMLEAQAVYGGLINPVVVPDSASSSFSITADNVGYTYHWDEPGIRWGDAGKVWGAQPSEHLIAKNVRAMLRFFRPARERYTGLQPTYWEPLLFPGLASLIEPKNADVVGGQVDALHDLGSIGGSLTAPSAPQRPNEFLLLSGSSLATFNGSSDRLDHDADPFYWRPLHGSADCFFWWAGVIKDNDVGTVLSTTAGTGTAVGFRLFVASSGTIGLTVGNGISLILSTSLAGFETGYYVITVSYDSNQGAFGGAVVTINGVVQSALGGDFTDAPASDQNPEHVLTIGDKLAGGGPYDGDFHGFGLVKGRPAITPDVTLLLRYFAAELNLGASGDWDPASESSYTLDWNPDNSASLTVIDDEIDAIADGAAVDVDSGLSISAASAPERMPLSVAQFAGGQDAAFADDAKVLGAADALVLGDMSDSTWFYVLWPHQATNGQSLLTVSGLFELWVDHTTGSDVELHDGTALRATGFTQPVGEGYVTSLYLDSGTGRARYGFNSQLAALLTYDGTLAFDTTPLTLGGAIGPGYIGRILAFNERMSDDEIKARSLALIGQYLLPKTAT